VACGARRNSTGIVDHIEMKVWIDEFGDIVWNNGESGFFMEDWTNYLHDAVREVPNEEEENINAQWMILE